MSRGAGDYRAGDGSARLFLAVAFPRELKLQIERATEPARSLEGLRWGRTDQLHLTLRFLGRTPRDRIAPIADRVGERVRALDPFPIELNGGGAFPTVRRPRVVWLGVRPTAELTALHETVQRALEDVGFPPEMRRFRPHVSLARVRDDVRPEGLAAFFDALDFDAAHVVDAVALLKSELRPRGAVHTRLASCPLGAARIRAGSDP
ncbi:MAG: RNA 2',3'-cyclic phosphodiesterase [Gemmatimonadetes bacterium]|nr:RNA 2',3'-cyclic phosphodiesterase [Gemmatimonadota bacterium]